MKEMKRMKGIKDIKDSNGDFISDVGRINKEIIISGSMNIYIRSNNNNYYFKKNIMILSGPI